MVNTISPAQLKEAIDQYHILDVREPDEESNGKIDGSTLMPLGLSIRNTKQGKLDDLKGKKICTYCASGYRANIAAEELEKAGFDVVNLEGGFMGWQNHNNSS
jgi:rhodanese-related sulfurtransferase|tara:strand:+ start:372 stop:680 length:309 start_codon:yes stop_codon:yes gene_type:complete